MIRGVSAWVTIVRRLHILFVDSDPHAQERIRSALENDFSVRCVGSVAEARVSLAADMPDILISEVVVDQESGLDLCRTVRSNSAQRHLPIMLLTSLGTLPDKVAGFAAGADDYVVEPFDAHHLIARIRLLSRIKHLAQNSSA